MIILIVVQETVFNDDFFSSTCKAKSGRGVRLILAASYLWPVRPLQAKSSDADVE